MIYLMRHGQDDENYIGGWSDGNLLDEGRKQVFDTSWWIKNNLKIEKIICSDIKRALETAKIVSEILDVPYEVNALLREQNKGLLNGMLKDKALLEYPEFLGENVTIDTVYPDGESLKDLYERVKENLDVFLKFKDNTLLITHRGVINMLYFILNDISLNMDKKQFGVLPASVHELNKNNKSIKKVR